MGSVVSKYSSKRRYEHVAALTALETWMKFGSVFIFNQYPGIEYEMMLQYLRNGHKRLQHPVFIEDVNDHVKLIGKRIKRDKSLQWGGDNRIEQLSSLNDGTIFKTA